MALNAALGVLLAVSLAGCEIGFTPELTPMQWATVGPAAFGQGPTLPSPQVSPVPLAPTPVLPPVFEGADSLDCAEAKGGDNHYGYCRVPGTDQFYVWGECAAACPEGRFPGIEIMVVTESTTFRNFQDVIDIRDQQKSQRAEGLAIGGGLGLVGVGGGIVGVIETCVVAGSFSLGWGCGLVLLAVGADLIIAGWQFDRGFDADARLNEPLGLDDSARELFEMLRVGGP
jgi:hypothetical protein